MKLKINNEEQSHFSLSGNRLNEESRTSLIQKSRKGSKVRYDKRMNYQITNFKGVNLEELFDNDYFVFTTPVGDYVCTIAFPGVLSYLKRTAKYTERIEQVSYQVVLRALELAYENTDDLKIDCTCPDFCLEENTKIKLLSGETKTVKELKNDFDDGKELWVYSTDEKGDFKPGKVNDIWVSGQATEMIKVTLDNGKEIITTPNHPYMLRDGSYLEAENLKVGQSLMLGRIIKDYSKVTYSNSIDVYDIEVDKYHNFYVDAGVILHNCYRYAFYASKNGYKYGKQETRPSKITNPDDTLGATCKHLDLLLSNKNWLSKAATSINQLIRTYPEKAETYIYTPEQIEKAHNTEKKHYSRKNDKSLSDWEREQREKQENEENNENEEEQE